MNADVIRLLPDSVANQIAAGEVIQRPASVIKELVENAVDAGADAITIILKDAGRTLIQVIDNGSGMSPTDARMAFERHATSKIRNAEDLFALHTMGFRGEALPSIAAVAQIELKTMQQGETMGTRLLISESKFESQEPCSAVPGTNLMVKNIFFHMPARRKFLKKDSVELGHILREFERLSLVNTGIDFTLIHNDVTLHQFNRGTFRQRIGALFGKNLESQLVPISTETDMVRISGYVALPQHAKKRGAHQYFFVNGRNMRHPYFHRAVMSCYEHLISADSQPSYFINFEVAPESIDVNIHPQKHEIKFEYEQPIYQILMAAIKESLGRVHAAGALDFDSEETLDIPIYDPTAPVTDAPGIDINPGYNPFDLSAEPGDTAPGTPSPEISRRPAGNTSFLSGGGDSHTRRRAAVDWESLYENFTRRQTEAEAEAAPATDTFDADIPVNETASDIPSDSSPAVQFAGRYIVSPSLSGLMVIDQKRAHTRILFERFLAQLQEGPLPSQRLLFPETVTLSPARSAAMQTLDTDLQAAGFDMAFLGDGTWAVNSIPGVMNSGNIQEVLNAILERAACQPDSPAAEIHENIALAMARSAAVGYGQTLTAREMDTLIADLLRTTSPRLTPDGMAVLTVLSQEDIHRLFV